MKRCIHCNNAIDDHYRICPYCGEDQDFTSSLPQSIAGRQGHREEVVEEERSRNFTLTIFLISGLLIGALSYQLVKQWKVLPLVFLLFIVLEYVLTLVSFQISRFLLDSKTGIFEFFDKVGTYSLVSIGFSIILLAASFFLSPRLVKILFALNIVLNLSSSLAVALGSTKRIYLILVGFISLFILIVLFLFDWFALGCL